MLQGSVDSDDDATEMDESAVIIQIPHAGDNDEGKSSIKRNFSEPHDLQDPHLLSGVFSYATYAVVLHRCTHSGRYTAYLYLGDWGKNSVFKNCACHFLYSVHIRVHIQR